LFYTSHFVFADEVPAKADNCRMEEKFTVSLQYLNTLKKDTDFGNYFKEKISLINKIVKKHKLTQCKVVSQDMTINPSAYDSGAAEVSVSLSLEVPLDYNAVNHLYLESKAYSTSVTRNITEVCDNGR
jgi:hypothetical protein